jgi:hypothetical protein
MYCLTTRPAWNGLTSWYREPRRAEFGSWGRWRRTQGGKVGIFYMTVKDNLSVWQPVPDAVGEMFVEAVYDDYEGFRILMRGTEPNSKMLRISFDAHLSYRNTDDSFMSRLGALYERLAERSTFYIVENSSYIDYFMEMSEGLHPPDWIIAHYAIYTPNDCIDVLSYHPPIVEWLN